MQLSKSFLTTGSEPSQSANLLVETYSQLHKTIDEMDTKVQHVIEKHESQFLYAYRNHITKIKKELAQIKHKSEEQQKMFSANDRIQYLEKQMIIFREQALKLYNKIDLKNQENQILKATVKELQKVNIIKQKEIKEYIRAGKKEEMNKGVFDNKTAELQEEIKIKDYQIERLNQAFLELKKQGTSLIPKSDKARSSMKDSTTRYSPRKAPSRYENKPYNSQLKQWFLECLKTVKREVANRTGHPTLELNQITNVDDFLMVDKLKLLELILTNQKLLTLMYERIFPDRLSQLRDRLGSFRENHQDKDRNQGTYSLSVERTEKIQKILLPQVKRYGKGSSRNTVAIKNGKLNISYY